MNIDFYKTLLKKLEETDTIEEIKLILQDVIQALWHLESR